ncbi:MAG TPA: SURF1 family protein [Pseudolabrys sp.]|nr:SURF1 family protein [Pseudolabrys sp.]
MRDPAFKPQKAPRSGLIEVTIVVVIGVAILCGLGVWQVQRKAWKENLIATLNARLSKPPADLPPRTAWKDLKPKGHEWHRVHFLAEFIPGQEALVYTAGSSFRPDVKGPGYWVFSPARLPGGSVVIIDRGFVPMDRKAAASHAAPDRLIDIVGVMRWPEKSGSFTPGADVKDNVWYARDIKAIAAAKQWPDYAPFYIEQESPVPPGGSPKPGKLVVNLPDNHLQYALTWFGMAAGLIGLYVFWLVRRRRAA